MAFRSRPLNRRFHRPALIVPLLLVMAALAATLAVPVSPAAADDPSVVSVVARGRLGSEDMELRINGEVVETWHDISRSGRTFSHTVERSAVIERLEVAVAEAKGWPESLIIDRVEIDGAWFQSEDGETHSVGSWTPSTGCRPGHKRSEWLQCDEARFEYGAARGITLTGPEVSGEPPDDPGQGEVPIEQPPVVEPPAEEPPVEEPPVEEAPVEEPPETPISVEPSVIEVRARGRLGTEDMAVQLNGRTIVGWDDVASGFRTYRVEVAETETIESLRVAMVGGGWPQALIVDRIEVDGVVHQSEAIETASTGSWTAATGCRPGRKSSEWLHCNDANFDYRQARGRVLAPGRERQTSRVLVMTKTSVFAHPSIADGRELLNRLAAEEGIELTYTEDSARFQDPAVNDLFDAVLFLNTDSVVFDTDEEKAAFRRFIEGGKGYVGIHGAAATHWNGDKWDWYRDLVGQRFVDHPRTPGQRATVRVIDRSHPSTAHLSETWSVRDEWYNFEAVPAGVDVLLAVDETTYTGGTMGAWHPIAWTQRFGPGQSRVWYSNLGHEPALYHNPDYIEHVRGGLRWVLER